MENGTLFSAENINMSTGQDNKKNYALECHDTWDNVKSK